MQLGYFFLYLIETKSIITKYYEENIEFFKEYELENMIIIKGGEDDEDHIQPGSGGGGGHWWPRIFIGIL